MARFMMLSVGLISIASASEETVNAMQRENVENSQSQKQVSTLSHMVKDVMESKSLKSFAHSALGNALMSTSAENLEEVLTELTNAVMPGLDSAHAADQQLLQNAEGSVCQCTTTRTSLDDAIGVEDQAFQDAKQEHAQCRSDLAQKIQTETSKCDLAEQTYNNAAVPNCAKPAQSGFQAFLKTAKEWYETMFAKYKQEAEECAAATLARQQKAQECIEKQAQTESSYCTWYASQWAQWTGYYSCLQSANNSATGYPAVKISVETREAARKEQVTHFQRVVCIIRDVLKLNTTKVTASTISAAANTCANQAPDLSGFIINYAFSDTCNYVAHDYDLSAPGDGSWGPEHYDNLDVDDIVTCYKGKHAPIQINKFNSADCDSRSARWTEALAALNTSEIILDDNESPLKPTSMRITMGAQKDYFKPTGSNTFKAMITSSSKHQWSPDGKQWYTPEYRTDLGYGGSKANWPSNNVVGESRKYLPFWNGDWDSSHCGLSIAGWGTAFTVEFIMI